jgi:hypothetical protein
LIVIRYAARFAEVPDVTTEDRHRYDRDKLRYPSHLTDAQWAHMKPLVPKHAVIDGLEPQWSMIRMGWPSIPLACADPPRRACVGETRCLLR